MITFRTLPKKGSLIAASLVFVIDQLSKYWVLENIGAGEISPFGPFMNIVLAFNPGVTFGWLRAYSNLQYIMLIVAVCALSLVVLSWWLKAQNAMQRYATAIILAGALGNLADRLRFRAVIDFLDFYIFQWHWYTFNIADSAIVLGVGLLMLDNFYKPKNIFLERK